MISWISLINFIIRRIFFSHLSHLFLATLSPPSSSSVSEFSSLRNENFHFLSSLFICAKARIQTEAITHHNHTPIIYYKTSKWRTATATEDKWNRPSSLRTWKRCDIKRRRRIKDVSARVISLQNFRKSNQQTLLRRKTNRLFWWTTNNTNTLFSLSKRIIENTRNRKSYKTR